MYGSCSHSVTSSSRIHAWKIKPYAPDVVHLWMSSTVKPSSRLWMSTNSAQIFWLVGIFCSAIVASVYWITISSERSAKIIVYAQNDHWTNNRDHSLVAIACDNRNSPSRAANRTGSSARWDWCCSGPTLRTVWSSLWHTCHGWCWNVWALGKWLGWARDWTRHVCCGGKMEIL